MTESKHSARTPRTPDDYVVPSEDRGPQFSKTARRVEIKVQTVQAFDLFEDLGNRTAPTIGQQIDETLRTIAGTPTKLILDLNPPKDRHPGDEFNSL